MKNQPVNRRKFVSNSLSALGITSLILRNQRAFGEEIIPQQTYTVQQIIGLILKEIPGAPFDKTVDTLKSGNGEIEVTGIVSTMFATIDVIRKSISAKANFIIAHEPTFYNHLDETNWLESDKIFQYKKELLQKNKIAIWRFHDYWHTHQPDGVRQGVLRDLGWEKFSDPLSPRIVNLPVTSLEKIINHAKSKLGIEHVRFIGELSQPCKKVLLMPGASGGRSQISQIIKDQPDLLICGEVSEWETAEYVRDARSAGSALALIVLGHSQSEEPGMDWLVPWLQPKVSPLKVIHIPSQNPFSWK